METPRMVFHRLKLEVETLLRPFRFPSIHQCRRCPLFRYLCRVIKTVPSRRKQWQRISEALTFKNMRSTFSTKLRTIFFGRSVTWDPIPIETGVALASIRQELPHRRTPFTVRRLLPTKI